MYDVAIIGGGIAGCACAYRLARCRVRVVLLEKENDICMGATLSLIHISEPTRH
mgnify:CR=1 FL=1